MSMEEKGQTVKRDGEEIRTEKNENEPISKRGRFTSASNKSLCEKDVGITAYLVFVVFNNQICFRRKGNLWYFER